MTTRTAWTFHRLTPERWDDLEALFGERGACGGCWCMAGRLSRSRWEAQKGAGNKGAFKRLVTSGGMPGVLAHVGGRLVRGRATGGLSRSGPLSRAETRRRRAGVVDLVPVHR